MERAAYNACMSPYMTGSKPKEQRQLDFCIGAKLCSGKAKSPEEAKTICLQPKPPKEAKAPTMRGGGKGSGVFVKIGRKTVELSKKDYINICPCAVGGE